MCLIAKSIVSYVSTWIIKLRFETEGQTDEGGYRSPSAGTSGLKNQEATVEKLATFYLFQSISMAIQRGNAACVTTCVKERSGLEGLFNFQIHKAEEL